MSEHQASDGGRKAEISALLRELGDTGSNALDRLLPLIYGELQQLARHHRFGWRKEPMPGTCSLVHEAYLRLAEQEHLDGRGRAQFFALASRAMRSILIDNARRAARKKREGGRVQVPLADDMLVSEGRSDELMALDDALQKLTASDARLGQIVECRVFGGLTVEESAEAMGLSPATVKRDWNLARAWLYDALKGEGAAGGR